MLLHYFFKGQLEFLPLILTLLIVRKDRGDINIYRKGSDSQGILKYSKMSGAFFL
jgi:hypothetical protein